MLSSIEFDSFSHARCIVLSEQETFDQTHPHIVAHFYFAHMGQCAIRRGAALVILRAGEFAVIPGGSPCHFEHHGAAGEASHFYYWNSRSRYWKSPRARADVGRLKPWLVALPITPDIAAFVALIEALDPVRALNAQQCHTALHSPLVRVARALLDHVLAGTPPQPTAGNPLVLRALAYIRAHACEDIHAADVARHFALSLRRLYALFARNGCVTPAECIWDFRTSAALGLLRRGSLALKEVAARTGFKTVQHLSHRVRQAIGQSPGEYSHAWETKGPLPQRRRLTASRGRWPTHPS